LTEKIISVCLVDGWTEHRGNVEVKSDIKYSWYTPCVTHVTA